jgi:hypothetical protein
MLLGNQAIVMVIEGFKRSVPELFGLGSGFLDEGGPGKVSSWAKLGLGKGKVRVEVTENIQWRRRWETSNVQYQAI